MFAAPIIQSAHFYRPSCTFYTQGGLGANGLTMRQNARRYGSVCAMKEVMPLYTRVLVSQHGFRHEYTVVDRISHGSDIDIYSLRSFCLIAGTDGARIGRLNVSIRVVGRARKSTVRRRRA